MTPLTMIILHKSLFFQLYNEEIIDLLDIENKGRKVIKIHEDVNSNIYTTGVTMRNVTSEKDVSLLKRTYYLQCEHLELVPTMSHRLAEPMYLAI